MDMVKWRNWETLCYATISFLNIYYYIKRLFLFQTECIKRFCPYLCNLMKEILYLGYTLLSWLSFFVIPIIMWYQFGKVLSTYRATYVCICTSFSSICVTHTYNTCGVCFSLKLIQYPIEANSVSKNELCHIDIHSIYGNRIVLLVILVT